MNFFNELRRRNVLRVATAYSLMAWLLIQVVDTIFPAFGFSASLVRHATIIAVIGLVPVVILAWVFELTPEGLKKDSGVTPQYKVTGKTEKTLDRVIIIVLALAVTYFGVDKFVLMPAREAALTDVVANQIDEARETGRSEAFIESYGDNSIAVLPFVNMSSDPEQDYFSDGISEELLNLLAQISELRVISRSSTFAFKDKDINIVELAEKLNVAHVLEGSVRKSGNQIRITAQLIEAATDTHLWSETYDRKLDNVFAIQDEIANAVVRQLKLKILGNSPTANKVNSQAYELFLKARHLTRSGDPEKLEEATKIFKQAIDIEENFVEAWDWLSINYGKQVVMGIIPPDEGSTLERLANKRALQINPDYSPALTSQAWFSMIYEKDFQAAATQIERALKRAPSNVSSLGMAALLLHKLGRTSEAVLVNQHAITIDPLSTSIRHNTSMMLFYLRRWEEAIASYNVLLRLSPDHTGTHFFIGLAQYYRGEPELALAAFEKERRESVALAGKAMAYHVLKEQSLHQQAFQELIDRWGDTSPIAIARVYLEKGMHDKAFEWLNKAVELKKANHFSPLDPGFSAMHDDPRWLDFLSSINQNTEELEEIKFNVSLLSNVAMIQ